MEITNEMIRSLAAHFGQLVFSVVLTVVLAKNRSQSTFLTILWLVYDAVAHFTLVGCFYNLALFSTKIILWLRSNVCDCNVGLLACYRKVLLSTSRCEEEWKTALTGSLMSVSRQYTQLLYGCQNWRSSRTIYIDFSISVQILQFNAKLISFQVKTWFL